MNELTNGSFINQPYSAVLVLAYKRFDFLHEILQKIPANRTVYIHIDGAKEGSWDEVQQTRSVAMKFQEVRKVGNVFVHQQNRNLGNRESFKAATEWVFQREDRLIVIEDDIRFVDEFFAFMDWSLERFKTDNSIFHINGLSMLDFIPGRNRLFCSINCAPWGWGTWRDRWQKSDIDLKNFQIDELFSLAIFDSVFLTETFKAKWSDRILRLQQGLDTYDIGWNVSAWRNNAYAISPRFTFTTNVGFDERSLHTRIRPRFLRKPGNIRSRKPIDDSVKIVSFPSYYDAYSDFIQWKIPGIAHGSAVIFIGAYYFLRIIKRFRAVLMR